MASLLRSSKFLRYFSGFARNLIFSSTRGDVDNTFVQRGQYLGTSLTKALATHAVPSHNQHDSNLDRNLRRLDQDVRRSGRISRRELEDVLEELRQTRSATSSQSLLIIRCCGNLVPEEPPETRTQLVQEIWKTLENLGIPMDISHYNALLRVYLENEHPFSPTEFLADLEQKGVEPNRVTYQRLIARYCQEGDIEGATRILEFMREKQLPVNENVFNALIMGHSQADDMESAAGILTVMQQAGLEPSSETYTTLLCGYAKKGDIESMEKILKEADAKEVDLLDRDYMDVIYSLAINNHIEHVDKIMSRMRQSAGYNQDAMNLVLRLVNQGHEDLGMKIYKTMPKPIRPAGQEVYLGAFFIRQLVRANRPIEKVLALCEELENDGQNSRALLFAVETSLQMGRTEQACSLLAAVRDRGLPIRQHYFWPLIAARGRAKDNEGVLNVLHRMKTDFELLPTGETVREFAIPNLTGSPEEVLVQLRSLGISPASGASAMVYHLLIQDKLAEAAKIATRYRAHYPPNLLRRPLVTALLHTSDCASFISVVRQIHEGLDRFHGDEEGAVPAHSEVVGQLLLDAATAVRVNRGSLLKEILQGLVDNGLSISNSTAEQLQERLDGEELTSEISSLLAKLTSGELTPSANSKASVLPSPMDEARLKKLCTTLESKGESTLGVKRQLFSIYCRSKDLEKIQQFRRELESDNFVFTGGMYAQLIEAYTHHEKLEEALDTLHKLSEKEPDFLLDDIKLMKIVDLLVKNNRTKEALALVSNQPRESHPVEERSFSYKALCWRILNTLAERKCVEELDQLFEALVQHELILPNNVLLGPLIKARLASDDVTGALEKFEWCCTQYRTTPWKNELACRLIQAEDAAALQRLTDLSTQVHGEVNSLYDLVFSFVECGRIRQARRILETPGLRSRPQRLSSACERYQQEGLVASLEGLVEATRDISHIDRSDIYYNLLLSYCKAGDTDKALGLWTRMQEEDVQPTDSFLLHLGNFLKEKGKPVPFVIPEPVIPEVPTTKVQGSTKEEIPKSSPTLIQQFRQAVRKSDFGAAMELKHKIDREGPPGLSVTEQSSLVEGFVKAGHHAEASKLVLAMLQNNIHPLPRVFRFLMSRLAQSGDIQTLTSIGNHLSPESKRLVSYDNRLCQANVVAGNAAEYLNEMEKEIDSAKEDNIPLLADKFPRGGASGILEKHPELISQFEQVSRKYAEKGVIAPINLLWIQYFLDGKEEAASKIWDEHLSKSPRVMFQRVVQVARERKDVDLARKLIEQLRGTPVSDGARGNAYSCLLDILVSHEKYEEGLEVLHSAVKDVCLENFNRTALQRLQEGLQSRGKEFPYTIPSKNEKSSSSSSSSSDEENVRSANKN